MKIKIELDLSVQDNRKFIVNVLADIKDPQRNCDHCQPWMPNIDDDYYWKFDAGNDWGVLFGDDPNMFEVKYRYHHEGSTKEAEFFEKLKNYLKVHLVDKN